MATTKKSTDKKEEPKGGTGLTTAALVLGIIGAVFAFMPVVNIFIAYPLGALAIIFGAIGVYKKHGGKAIAGLILGIATIVVATLMNVLVFNVANTMINDYAKKASGEATDYVLENDIDVRIGKFTVKDDDSFADTALPVTVTNKTDRTISVNIKIEAVNSEEVIIDSEDVFVGSLGAGDTVEETAFKYVLDDDKDAMKAATYRVSEVSEW
ncbi:DUF4190 domain-containing protein [Candidatus Saccharibacteria bacterium]|nr:DUF4190 domain-containing protein [Candidatus Saccharibacteria bacterium]